MRPDDATLEQLLTGLHKVGLALRSDARDAGVETGLSPAQREILALLRARDRELRLADVAAELGVHAPAASECVTALVEKGLVRKARSRADGRALALALTASGRRAADERPQWTDLMLAAASDLSPEERDVFLRGLVKRIQRLETEGRNAAARMCASCVYFRPHAHPGARKPHHCAFIDAPLALLQKTLLFGQDDVKALNQSHDVSKDQVEAVLDVWYGFVGSNPHLLASF